MRINEMRKSLVLSSSKDFIEEICEYFFNGSFSNKGIREIRDLFAYSHNNMSKRNEEDFKYFYDKVAYVDYCKFNNLPFNALAAKKYLAAAFNPNTREFSYSSDKFYKKNSKDLNIILVLNVKGKDIYKVLTAIYNCLKENDIDNCITIPSYNRFEEGLTDSIRININIEDMERVVNLIGDLPLPIINLIDKPNMLYPRVNDYIGYDALVEFGNQEIERVSAIVCQAISYALYYTILDFLENSPKETIENGVDAESILRYRERCLNENQSLIECDLRILQRMIAIDPANKNIFVKNLTDALLKVTNTKSAYIDKDTNDLFDEFYGKLDDETILFNGELEISVSSPTIEIEDDLAATQEQSSTQNSELSVQEESQTSLMVKEDSQTDLMVKEDEVKDLMVKEEQSKDLMVIDDEPKDLLVSEEKVEETLSQENHQNIQDSFANREASGEAYLDSLLASAMGKNEQETTEETAESTRIEVEQPAQEDVHFYENASNVGSNFVVSSTPAETEPVKEVVGTSDASSENRELVRPEDITEEDKKLITDTFSELPEDDSQFSDYLEQVLSKFPNESETNDNSSSQSEEELNPQEIQSLSSNPLDQQMTYERALKYKDLVSSISILNTNVKGTDFTLLDYFDQQQLLDRIKPNAKYMTFNDEVYSGLELVENCVIKYVANYGNVPLDKIMEEYGIQELAQEEKKERPKGLRGLFRRKRS